MLEEHSANRGTPSPFFSAELSSSTVSDVVHLFPL